MDLPCPGGLTTDFNQHSKGAAWLLPNGRIKTMKNLLRNVLLAVVLAVISAPFAWSQATMRSTTLAGAITATAQTLTVASATGILVNMVAFVDGELMRVTAVNGTTLTVQRNVAGRGATRHANTATIYVDLANYFGVDPSGTGYATSGTPCTSNLELVLPRIDPLTATISNCTDSLWVPQTVTDIAMTSPTITTDIRSNTAGSATVGTAALPFGTVFNQGATFAILEGATADGFETTVGVTDPGVDITYNLQNKTVAATLQLLDTGLPPLLTDAVAAVLELPDSDMAKYSINQVPLYKAWFRHAPVYTMGVPTTAGGGVVCTTTGTNYLAGPGITGYGFQVTGIGTTTLCGNTWAAADGLKLTTDAADNEGYELNQGPLADSPVAFTIGTSPAFYLKVRFAIADITASDQTYFCLRNDGAHAATLVGQTDTYCIGLGQLDDATTGNDWWQQTEINNAGSLTATDLAEANITNDQVHTVTILVSGAGVVTAEIEGAAVGDTTAYTFDDGDEVVPMVFMIQQEASAIGLDVVFWEVGLQ